MSVLRKWIAASGLSVLWIMIGRFFDSDVNRIVILKSLATD